MYPPLFHRRPERSDTFAPTEPASAYSLSYVDPRSWRRLTREMRRWRPHAFVVPWFHPVMAPPFSYLFRQLPATTKRVVICHNVVPHEPFRGWRQLTRAVFRRADRLIVHAPTQNHELRELGVTGVTVTNLFLPRFGEALPRRPDDVTAFRSKLGDPEYVLLCFGIVRRYKGFDLAVDALGRLVADGYDVKLVIAGRIFDGGDQLRERIASSGVADRVMLLDEYVPDARVPVLFRAADVTLLPYRTASQSAVAQLSFSHGCPVVATAVGGLPDAIRDGVDGVLVPSGDVVALADGIARILRNRDTFRENVDAAPSESSFDRYAELLLASIDDPAS